MAIRPDFVFSLQVGVPLRRSLTGVSAECIHGDNGVIAARAKSWATSTKTSVEFIQSDFQLCQCF